MKVGEKISAIFFITFCILFICYAIYSNKKADQENLNRSFSGIIQSVKYDEKGIPLVKVNSVEYYLEPGYNFEHKLKQGDSIIKEKGSNLYQVFKFSGEEISFEN